MVRPDQVEKAKELQQTIEQLTSDASTIGKEVKALGEEKTTLEGELGQLNQKLQVFQVELPKKRRMLQELMQKQMMLEGQYMAMLEADKTLVKIGK